MVVDGETPALLSDMHAPSGLLRELEPEGEVLVVPMPRRARSPSSRSPSPPRRLDPQAVVGGTANDAVCVAARLLAGENVDLAATAARDQARQPRQAVVRERPHTASVLSPPQPRSPPPRPQSALIRARGETSPGVWDPRTSISPPSASIASHPLQRGGRGRGRGHRRRGAAPHVRQQVRRRAAMSTVTLELSP